MFNSCQAQWDSLHLSQFMKVMPFIVRLCQMCQLFQMALSTHLINALLKQSLSSPTPEATKYLFLEMKQNHLNVARMSI